MNILTSPSLFAADLANIESEVRRTEEAGADLIYFDVMDGVYVPNISIGFEVLKTVRGLTELPLDVHMMTVRPQDYLERLSECGADIVTVHNDIADEETVRNILNDIHSYGMMSGLALRPDVSADAVLPFLDAADMILVMTVNPGFSGQKFMDMSEKIKTVRDYIGLDTLSIEVDGGINAATARICAAAGANIFVAGSSAYGAPSMKDALDGIKFAALAATPE